MGSLKRKLEGEIEIRATAANVHHEAYESRPHHVAHVAPHFVQSCDLHEGELGKPGSNIIWKYNIGGKFLVAKNIIEEIDKEKKLVRQRCFEGDALNEYKTISSICQIIPKDTQTSIVRWTIEYEKLHGGVPEPTAMLDSLLAAAKDIDDHHHSYTKRETCPESRSVRFVSNRRETRSGSSSSSFRLVLSQMAASLLLLISFFENEDWRCRYGVWRLWILECFGRRSSRIAI